MEGVQKYYFTRLYSGTPFMTDTIGNQNFVPNSKVSLTQGLPVYLNVTFNCVY